MKRGPKDELAAPTPDPVLARTSEVPADDGDDELPVVARMVVEIRSDGSRTVARGAIEDVVAGQKVAVVARGDSPLSLAMALARSLTSLPRLSARAAVRGLLTRRSRK